MNKIPRTARRIAILGAPGSGKSTSARVLAARMDLPVHHMDHIPWQPGWHPRDRTERLTLVREILAREAWIFEGGFSKIQSERLARAEVVIWLDLPFGLRAWRVLRRTLRWLGRVRPDMQKGCPEGLNPDMLRFFHYIWQMRHTARAKIAHSLDPVPPHLCLIHLRRVKDVRHLIRTL